MVYNNIKKYVIVDFDNSTKIFNDTSSKKAANQVFSYLLKFVKSEQIDDGNFLVFVIKNVETNKEYKYMGTRIKLENPVNINNVIYTHKNIIAKYKKELDQI